MKVRLVPVLLAAALATTGCSLERTNDTPAGTVRVVIGYQSKTINTVTAGTLLRAQGYLEQRLQRLTANGGAKYQVEWQDYDTGAPITAQMVAEKIDIGSMGDYPLLINGSRTQATERAATTLVSVTGYNPRGALNMVVVPTDSAVSSISDLAGQKISASVGSAGHGALVQALSRAGIDPSKDVEVLNQQPQIGATALESHQVGALSQFVAWPGLLVFQNKAKLLYDGAELNVPTFHGVVARRSYAAEHPEVLQAFLAAQLEATAFLRDKPFEAARIVTDSSGLPQEVVYLYNGPGGTHFDTTLKPSLIDALKGGVQYLTSIGDFADLDIDAFVDSDPLREAYAASGQGSYEQALASIANPSRITGSDPTCGVAVDNPALASELWIDGAERPQPAADPTCLLRAIQAAQAQGRVVRAAYLPDAELGTRWFADKAVWVRDGAKYLPGLYAAGDLACVPHNYMIGAFVFGDLAGAHAASTLADVAAPSELAEDQLAAAHELIYRSFRHPDGPPQPQVEYKLRRFVNDYVAPPKTAAKLSIAIETFERMRTEIDGIGARTPHELMRAVEVSFIRDCAEMAARSSLTRTESRWGLYHERADLPERDDTAWRYHLNLRKNAEGAMEFHKRPVAPYLVPVPELDDLPLADPTVFAVEQPELTGQRAPQTSARAPQTTSATAPSPRLVTLLGLDSPTGQDLLTYLTDEDAGVRVAAISMLTEHTPDGFAPALVSALDDDTAAVRRAAAESLRELVEVLPAATGLSDRLDSPDPFVRATMLDLLRALRAGSAPQYSAALADPDHRVRIEAVRALVSLDDRTGVSALAADDNRGVRIAVAQGLAAIGDGGAEVIRTLTRDPDPLVRATALAAFAALGASAEDAAELAAALRHSAWQVRVGAARGLAGTTPDRAVPALTDALLDPHLDVRKAAVLALSVWPDSEPAHAALKRAIADTDADVRSYARRAVTPAGVGR